MVIQYNTTRKLELDWAYPKYSSDSLIFAVEEVCTLLVMLKSYIGTKKLEHPVTFCK